MQWELFSEHPTPLAVYRWLRDEAPVYLTPTLGHYALSRHADIAAALLDHQTFSSRLSAFPRPEHLPIVHQDPPKHDELRALISKPFLSREVSKLEDSIRAIVVRRLDALADKGWGDLVTEFAELIPSDVIGGLLGVDEGDRPKLRRAAGDYLSRDPNDAIAPPRAVAGIEFLKQYFVSLRPGRDANPREDLITTISQARARGARLSDGDFGAMCAMIAVAGYETTTNLISHALVELHRHPDQRAWLAEHPQAIPNGLREVLRYRTPIPIVGRVATRDVQLHGQTIPRGAPVVLIVCSAARDERHYRDPNRFDVRREDSESIAFGQGRHTCFGAPLARLEGRVVLEEVLRRFPRYEVDESSLLPSGPGNTNGYQRALIRLDTTSPPSAEMA
jgi:cytochrome P450